MIKTIISERGEERKLRERLFRRASDEKLPKICETVFFAEGDLSGLGGAGRA